MLGWIQFLRCTFCKELLFLLWRDPPPHTNVTSNFWSLHVLYPTERTKIRWPLFTASSDIAANFRNGNHLARVNRRCHPATTPPPPPFWSNPALKSRFRGQLTRNRLLLKGLLRVLGGAGGRGGSVAGSQVTKLVVKYFGAI